MERSRPAALASSDRWLIDDVVVDAGRRKLWREGQPLPVTRLTFDLLLTLIAAAPRVVAHDEIIARVWGTRRIVSPETLAQLVGRLRQALNDDAAHPRYIESIRGSGYRLIPPVRLAADSTSAPAAPPDAGSAAERAGGSATEPAFSLHADHVTAARSPWRRLAGLAALGALVAVVALGVSQMIGGPVVEASGASSAPGTNATQARSLAVLPIPTVGMDPADVIVAEGVHADILSELARIGELRVIARATMLRYANTELSITEIADELNVESVMQLEMRLADQRLDLTAELIDGRTGTQRRFDRYEQSLGDVYALQRELVANVAGEIGARLTDAEQARLQARPTVSTEAYEFFLMAADAFNLDYLDQAMIARSSLDKAIALDPEFARAYGFKGLIYAYGIDGFTGSDEDAGAVHAERARLARRYAAKAIEIDPDTVVAHRALAITAMHSWRWNEARQAFEAALAHSPSDIASLAEFGFFSVCALEDRIGFDYLQRALDLDPGNSRVHELYGRTLNCVGDPESALAAMQRASDLDPTSFRYRATGTYIGTRIRAPDETARELQALEPMLRDAQLQAYTAMALAYRKIGRDDDARRLIARFDALHGHEMSNPGNSVSAYLAVGDEERAYETLELAVNHLGPGSGYLILMVIKRNLKDIAVLDEPRFVKLRERIGSVD